MIHLTDIFAVPLLLGVWAIDGYLFMLSLRLVADQVAGARSSEWHRGLCRLVDGPPRVVEDWLARQRGRRSPGWMPWVIIIVGIVLLRQLLAGVVVSLG
jgi:hypothetical protein